MTNVLLAFTGGIDSTYLLSKLLTSTTGAVSAVYFQGNGTEQYGELPAVRSIAAYLMSRVRPFNLTVADQPCSDFTGWVTPKVIEAGASMMSGYDEFYTGRGIDNGRVSNDSTLDNNSKVAYYQKIFMAKAPDKVLRFPLTEWGKSRAHAVNEMPRELFDLTFSCIRPQLRNNVLQGKCGVCAKCLMNADCVAMLAQGKSPDEICDYMLRMRGTGKYADQGPADGRYQFLPGSWYGVPSA